ncbi:MAG: 1-deoxy-D-xylulose-5-phosphate reductoisomerase [Thermogutta sp.]|nr:1-deoxy-D-xylulose-5-phosphate reductoisomerase [Thermogutta sp.]
MTPERAKGVAVLGSTGSIGRSALEVIAASQGRLRASVLVARRQTSLLWRQARQFGADYVVVTDSEAAEAQDWSGLPGHTRLLVGQECIRQAIASAGVDIVLSAFVGAVGLQGTMIAIQEGKPVALANKESMVVAGPIITRMACERGVPILPVDSEHSAIFQCLQAGRRDEVRRIVLTASGGPFRLRKVADLANVTVEEALAHPTWSMGRKITIDSATLMNKALEIIEARWLFDVEAGRIGVLIHPQSIVHSMVEFNDGSVIAQLSPPDMRLPIQYALYWPERRGGIARKLDWSQGLSLQFEPPDYERFAALKLGLEAAEAGGTAGTVLNAANEAAVEAFLNGRLRFDQIVPACRDIVDCHPFHPDPSLERILELDAWAREEINRWISA